LTFAINLSDIVTSLCSGVVLGIWHVKPLMLKAVMEQRWNWLESYNRAFQRRRGWTCAEWHEEFRFNARVV